MKEESGPPIVTMPIIEVDSSILCSLCGQKFSNVSNCNRHLKMAHKMTPKGEVNESPQLKFACELCEKEFTRSDNLQSHINNIHLPDTSKLHKCNSCNYETVYINNFKRHIERRHNIDSNTRALPCTCGKIYYKKSTFDRHVSSAHQIVGIKEVVVDEVPKIKFLCKFCDNKFTRNGNLQIHIKKVHLNVESSRRSCSLCSYESVYESNLRRHMATQHKKQTVLTNSESKTLHECSICDAQFSCLKNLRYHERKIHAFGKCKDIKRKCPLCEFTSFTRTTDVIYTHFENVHNTVVNSDQYQFKSIKEFNSWKREVEVNTKTKYKVVNKTYRSIGYQCHRSGIYKKILGVGNRHLNITRSCKINGFCPAVIKVQLDKSSVTVQHIPVHIGHKYCKILSNDIGMYSS